MELPSRIELWQLPDESVAMRYPTREYQTDQASESLPFCSQHTAKKYLVGNLDWPTPIRSFH